MLPSFKPCCRKQIKVRSDVYVRLSGRQVGTTLPVVVRDWTKPPTFLVVGSVHADGYDIRVVVLLVADRGGQVSQQPERDFLLDLD